LEAGVPDGGEGEDAQGVEQAGAVLFETGAAEVGRQG